MWLLPAATCILTLRKEEKKEKKRKVYAVRRHDGSLCTQKKPEILIWVYQNFRIDPYRLSIDWPRAAACASAAGHMLSLVHCSERSLM